MAEPQSPEEYFANRDNWHHVSSSNVDSIAHLSAGHDTQLRVRFKSGHEYHYLGVPASVFSAFLRSASKGTFLYEQIRNHGRDDRYTCLGPF